MKLWGQVFARLYDRCMAATEEAGLGERRTELLRAASGAVVEIGAGTGANLSRYPAAVTEIVLVEPEPPMVARLRRRAAEEPRARIVQAPAEAIPLPDGAFDVAVATLVLCTVSDPGRALAELRRLLRPGGRLLFVEHVRAEDPRLARWQDRLTPLWRRVGHGCHPNRPTLPAIERAGFTVESLSTGTMPKAPPIVRPLIAGVAVASAA